MNKYHTVCIDLPTTIPGYSILDKATDFITIVLNSRHSYDKQKKTYIHEVEHIEGNDFDKKESADEIEVKRHERGML